MVVVSDRTELDVEKFNRLYGGTNLVFGESYNRAAAECRKRVKKCISEKINAAGYFKDALFSPTRQKEILFIDPDSPQHAKFSSIESFIGGWKRLCKLLPDGELVKDGVNVTDIKQGKISDCWYVSALSVTALQPERLFRCLVEYDVAKGVYGFIFYKHGRWTPVIIDDYFPIGSKGKRKNKLILSRSTDENETWVPLFEKAYAKLHGSFEAICTGRIHDGVTDLTAGVSRVFKIPDIAPEKKKLLWQQILKCGEWRFIGCSIKSIEGEKKLENGLIAGHAYGIISHYVHNTEPKVRLIKIRNPHAGGTEWNGRWSDKSPLWQKHPEIATACGHTDTEDGMFWMCWTDFLDTWTTVFSTRVFSDKKKYTQLYDYSSPKQGYTRYSFEITQDKDVSISIEQFDLRYAQQLQKYSSIGLTIRTADKSWTDTVPSAKRRSVGWWSTGKLPANRYVLIVRSKSNEPVPFCIRLFASGKNTITKGKA